MSTCWLGIILKEFQNNTQSDSEQVFRKSVKRKVVWSGVLCLISILLLVVLFFLPESTPEVVGFAIVIVIFPITFVLGMLGLVYYAKGSSMFFRGMDILRQITPPEMFIEGKFAILNKDPVYAIVQWWSNTLFFLAFFQSERSFDTKVKIPKVIWKWDYSHQIGEIKVARKEGEFTIPVDQNTFYTGKGIVYSVFVTLQKKYTTEQLNKIIDSFAREIKSNGSGRTLVDEDF